MTGSDTAGQPVLTRISYGTTLSATSSGSAAVWNTVFDTTTVASTARWASMKTIYMEWRPVAMQVVFHPNAQNAMMASPTPSTMGPNFGGNFGPLFLLPYKGSATAVSSAANAMDHQYNRVIVSLNQKGRCSVRMDEADEASWVSTSGTTPGAVMGIKTYASWNTEGASDVTVLGLFEVNILVQFRAPVATSLQHDPNPFFPAAPASGNTTMSPSQTNLVERKEECGSSVKVDERRLSAAMALLAQYESATMGTKLSAAHVSVATSAPLSTDGGGGKRA